jgi:hypothetical protein
MKKSIYFQLKISKNIIFIIIILILKFIEK